MGQISLSMEGESDKTLDIIYISGLQSSPDLVFSSLAFPGDARECGDQEARRQEWTGCWTQQQDVVLLRNIDLSLLSNVVIEWNQPSRTTTTTTTTTSTTTL